MGFFVAPKISFMPASPAGTFFTLLTVRCRKKGYLVRYKCRRRIGNATGYDDPKGVVSRDFSGNLQRVERCDRRIVGVSRSGTLKT